MTDMVRAYVNGTPVDVPRGAVAADAVWAADPRLASEFDNGDWVITDSRGLPTAGDTPVVYGAVFRLIPARRP
jgi:hypothetical protein